MKKLLSLSLILISFYILSAQENVEFKFSNFPDKKKEVWIAKRNIRKGDAYLLKKEKPKVALENYLSAQEFNPDNAELNYKIGKCYMEGINKNKALSYLEKAVILDPNAGDDLWYLLGRARHLNYQFKQAIDAFNKFMSKNNLSDKDLKEELKMHLTHCRNAQEMINDTVDVTITNMGEAINTEYPEYNPIVLPDGSKILFTARRKYYGNQIDVSDGMYCEDIWYSQLEEDSTWKESELFSKNINTKGHDAVNGISTDGQKVYVYKPQSAKGGDIYYSELDGKEWTEPKTMGEQINTKYHESKVSISYDEKDFYVVSNRPEGNYGKRDIYVSHRQDTSWSKPENIGPVINTKYDEEGVLIHPDGKTLYFCSKGHNSMGGFDIFKSVKDEEGNWSTPENLGYPINTPGDEAFFSISADGRHAYISSVRPEGYGSYDIYEIVYPKDTSIKKVEKVEANLTLFVGFVKDAKTMEPLESTIEIIDNEKNEVIVELKSNKATGKFVSSLPSGKNYGLSVNKKGYMFHSENFIVEESSGFNKVTKEILLQPIEVGTKIVLENIFFDFNKATLREESFAELDKVTQVMNDNPNIEIEISGHTDNVGSMEYNKKLSKARAKSVVDYLIEKGIDKSRIKYEGYAFTKPIATNETDEGRQENRRVEFEVLKENE